MSRAVLADHVLFNECVYYLREDLHKKIKDISLIRKNKLLVV